jgi:nitric oxide reductase NorD protein
MSEPEEVILDGAHHATTFAAALWRRRSKQAAEPVLLLGDVRQRLELFTGAVFCGAPPIGVAEPPPIPNWFARIVHRIPSHLLERHPRAWTDGERIRLPARMSAREGLEPTFARYRLLAVEQAARAARGTPGHLPRAGERLLRDLFLLADAAAVDRMIAVELPGLLPDLLAARAAALGQRPARRTLTPVEERVEAWLQALLGAHPADPPSLLPMAATPAGSLAWAKSTAFGLRSVEGRYRGVAEVELWGRVEAATDGILASLAVSGGEEQSTNVGTERMRTLVRRPRVRHAPEDEDDAQVGMWMVQIDDPQESVEDPMGLQRPTDRDEDADPGDLADSLSELPEARLVPVPGTPHEVLVSEDPPARTTLLQQGVRAGAGIAYAEWDWRIGAYHPHRAVVRERPATGADASWAEGVLKRHAREVQRVRRRFERLRPQRIRLGRQLDGAEVDLSAYVTNFADRRAGGAADDRLYEAVRPMRRDIAIMLLVDISGSTDSWVGDTRRIIDVEKEALLLVCEALDALGDRYAVLAFSGEGPEAVSLLCVKAFTERYGSIVRHRIGALEPDRYTRAGAAIRHATAALSRESVRHRLLLVLSDGKPNDVDLYEGRYGIEDTRQAVAEARLQGIHPFCLTVDRQAPTYLPRIFGPGGHAVLRHAEMLPQVLIEVVRRLLKG